MPVLSFKEQFADQVESGEKLQTIRRVWKRSIKVGDTLHLKAGMRTKHCRPLGTTICTNVTRIWMFAKGAWKIPRPEIVLRDLDTRALSHATAGRLARADGFRDAKEMVAWFNRQYGLPFVGVVIAWSCPDWPRANRRRGALIRQEIAGHLSGAETRELEGLQKLADIISDAVDPLPLERPEREERRKKRSKSDDRKVQVRQGHCQRR